MSSLGHLPCLVCTQTSLEFGACHSSWKSSHPCFTSSIFLLPSLFICLLVVQLTCMLNLLKLFDSSWIFCYFGVPFFSSLYFSFENFCWHIFKLTGSFLIHVQSTDESIKATLCFCYNVFISSISFRLSLWVSIFLYILPSCSCMSCPFSIKDL